MNAKKTMLLAAVGGLAYYLYNRMDEEKKQKVVRTVRDQLDKTMDRIKKGSRPLGSRLEQITTTDTGEAI